MKQYVKTFYINNEDKPFKVFANEQLSKVMDNVKVEAKELEYNHTPYKVIQTIQDI